MIYLLHGVSVYTQRQIERLACTLRRLRIHNGIAWDYTRIRVSPPRRSCDHSAPPHGAADALAGTIESNGWPSHCHIHTLGVDCEAMRGGRRRGAGLEGRRHWGPWGDPPGCPWPLPWCCLRCGEGGALAGSLRSFRRRVNAPPTDWLAQQDRPPLGPPPCLSGYPVTAGGLPRVLALRRRHDPAGDGERVFAESSCLMNA